MMSCYFNADFLVIKGMQGESIIRPSKQLSCGTDSGDEDVMTESQTVLFDLQDDMDGLTTDENKMADSDNVEEGEVPVDEV
jgi:hypothetical protein